MKRGIPFVATLAIAVLGVTSVAHAHSSNSRSIHATVNARRVATDPPGWPCDPCN